MASTSEMHAAMEPAAAAALSPEHAALASIAISLKRIADALDGNETNQGIGVTLFYAGQAVEKLARRLA